MEVFILVNTQYKLSALLEMNYHEQLESAIEDQLEQHPELYTYAATDHSDFELENIDIHDTTSECFDNGTIESHIKVICQIIVYPKGKNVLSESYSTTKYFEVVVFGDLSAKLPDLKIQEIKPYDSEHWLHTYSDILLPVLYDKDYDDVALQLLMNYCGEIPTVGRPLNPMQLIDACRLSIIYAQISQYGDVQAEIIFTESDISTFDEYGELKTMHVMPGTIIIDITTLNRRKLKTLYTLIVHEFCHFILDRFAMMLRSCFDESINTIEEKTESTDDTCEADNDDLEFRNLAEAQVVKLTSRLFMPSETFNTAVNESFESYRKKYPDQNEGLIYTLVTEDLATAYRTSKQSVKMRMIYAGWTTATGCLDYVDGHYVTPYSFEDGTLQKGNTITINEETLNKIFIDYPNLLEGFMLGALVYVDSHLCINDSKFVITDKISGRYLTEYALGHTTECCLQFEVKRCKYTHRNEYGILYCLVGPDKQYMFNERDNFDTIQKLSSKLEEETSTIEMLNSITTLAGKVRYLYEQSGKKQDEIAVDAGLSRKCLDNILSGKTKQPAKSTIIQLSIGLGVSAAITLLLLGEIHVDLIKSTDPIDRAYYYLLYYFSPDLELWNKYLASRDLPQLGDATVRFENPSDIQDDFQTEM